jgi:hypothetical protein
MFDSASLRIDRLSWQTEKRPKKVRPSLFPPLIREMPFLQHVLQDPCDHRESPISHFHERSTVRFQKIKSNPKQQKLANLNPPNSLRFRVMTHAATPTKPSITATKKRFISF